MKKARLAAFSLLMLAVPAMAWAEEGLHHGTSFELRRDGSLIANFLVLFAGLAWIFYRFLLPALRKRTEDLAETMNQSENARKEAAAKLAELDAKMKEFEAQAVKIKEEARAQGEQIKEKLIAEAALAASRMVEKAKEEIENEAGKARERLRKDAVETAAGLAAGLLAKNFAESDQRKAVGDYIKSVSSGKGKA